MVAQSRRRNNKNKPGILLINQGNRTWKQDKNLMEFANTIIVTDADGDGIANEVMLNRGFCFPQRAGPGADPRFPEYGGFSRQVKEFCTSRPVGTTAIYKFNQMSQELKEISLPYSNMQAGNGMQPTCCPHDSFDGANRCNAISMASADFDGEDIADHLFLYVDKPVVYFSSERSKGALPIGDIYKGLLLHIPEYCNSAESVRVVDLDYDGSIDILVMCSVPGAFAMYSQRNDNNRKMKTS